MTTKAVKTVGQLLLRRDAARVALGFASGVIARGRPDDAALLNHCADFQKIHAALVVAQWGTEDDEFEERHHWPWHEALTALIPMQAHTLAGLQAKAACLYPVLSCLLGQPENDIAQQPELQLALSIVEDLARLKGDGS